MAIAFQLKQHFHSVYISFTVLHLPVVARVDPMATFDVYCSILQGDVFRRFPDEVQLLAYSDKRVFVAADGFQREFVNIRADSLGQQLCVYQQGRMSAVFSFKSTRELEHFCALADVQLNQRLDAPEDVDVNEIIEIIQRDDFPQYVQSVETVLENLIK